MSGGNDQLKRYGYILHSQSDFESGRSAALEFIIRQDIEQSTFSPQHVALNVTSRENIPEGIRIFHPWTFQTNYRVTLGRVEMRASGDRKVVLFTFGGNLHLDNHDKYLTGLHESPAPIFLLKEDINTVHTLLADQVMILLKTHSSADDVSQRTMQENLAGAHPLQLYISCLKTLQEKYRDHTSKNMPHVHDFVHFIQNEINRMERSQKRPGNVPLLNELLKGGSDSIGI
jgi:hypothetical protein